MEALFLKSLLPSGLTWPSPIPLYRDIRKIINVIKTYLRSSIQQEHLNSLAIMAFEYEIRRGLHLDKMLRNFANVKVQKISLS